MAAKSGEITATGAVVLGPADKAGKASAWMIQLTDHSSTTATIAIKAKVIGAGHGAYQAAAGIDQSDLATVVATVATADLPILIKVDAGGLDIELDCTAIAAGGVYYDAEPVR